MHGNDNIVLSTVQLCNIHTYIHTCLYNTQYQTHESEAWAVTRWQNDSTSINQSRFFYSGLSNLNHCEVHYSARRKDCCSRNVFKWRLNDCDVEAETMCSGREFQMWAAATGKARLPTVARLTGSTTRRLVPAERSALRPGTSTVEVSGPRYRGALPCQHGDFELNSLRHTQPV